MITPGAVKSLKGKTVLTFFIITSCVYAFMLLVTIPHVMAFANGMPLLDMMPAGYSHGYVFQLLEALGADGRDAYVTKQIPVDMIYPGLFAITYLLVFRYFLNKTGSASSRWNVISLLPLIAGFCDYVENFLFINMIIGYPEISQQTVRIASIFSVAKSGTTTIYFVSLSLLLIFVGVKAFRKSKQSARGI
ncbi:MAG TPA: hypothetical protein VGD40_20820 [Chryseosolibacter sp.]